MCKPLLQVLSEFIGKASPRQSII